MVVIVGSNPGTVYWSNASYYIQVIHKNKGSRMGHTKKNIKKKIYIWLRCKSAICRLNNDYVVCDAFDANRYRNL